MDQTSPFTQIQITRTSDQRGRQTPTQTPWMMNLRGRYTATWTSPTCLRSGYRPARTYWKTGFSIYSRHYIQCTIWLLIIDLIGRLRSARGHRCQRADPNWAPTKEGSLILA